MSEGVEGSSPGPAVSSFDRWSGDGSGGDGVCVIDGDAVGVGRRVGGRSIGGSTGAALSTWVESGSLASSRSKKRAIAWDVDSLPGGVDIEGGGMFTPG